MIEEDKKGKGDEGQNNNETMNSIGGDFGEGMKKVEGLILTFSEYKSKGCNRIQPKYKLEELSINLEIPDSENLEDRREKKRRASTEKVFLMMKSEF